MPFEPGDIISFESHYNYYMIVKVSDDQTYTLTSLDLKINFVVNIMLPPNSTVLVTSIFRNEI